MVMKTRHQVLQHMHSVRGPETYLETGVQHGWSITLAHGSRVAIGVDPVLIFPRSGNMELFETTSDLYFADQPEDTTTFGKIDAAFIDGMHLVEFALRDFINIERRSNDSGVIVFDDVLPRNQEEANRVQCPGDWTGDVWKIYYILREFRPDLHLVLLNSFPTGTLIVTDLDPENRMLSQRYEQIEREWIKTMAVPDEVLKRERAEDAEQYLQSQGAWL